MYASQRGHVDVVKELIEHEAGIDAVCKDSGMTALMYAAEEGITEVVTLLLQANANFHAYNVHGLSAFLLCCRDGFVDLVNILIQSDEAIVRTRSRRGESALMLASQNGHLSVAYALLDAGIDVDATRENDGVTALMLAAAGGHYKTVRLLLRRRAVVQLECIHDFNAYAYAGRSGRLKAVAILMEHFAEKSEHLNVLSLACMNGHADVAELIMSKSLQGHTNIDVINGEYLLIEACEKGHMEVFRFLIERGVKVNVTQADGLTPLIAASSEGHVEMVRTLIEKGGDVTMKQTNGITALMRASERGHIAVVRLLAERRETIDAHDKDGRTSLMLASQEGHSDIVHFLIRKEARVDQVQKSDGHSALMLACLGNHLETAEELIQSNADVNIKARDGSTPLAVAQRGGGEFKDLIWMLQRAGAVGDPSDTLRTFQLTESRFVDVSTNRLGAGSFGIVLRGWYRDTTSSDMSEHDAAVKHLTYNPRTSQDVENEINKMKMLQLDPHDNIVRFYGSKITNCEAYIVMEYCDGGSLYAIIHDKPDKSKKQPPLPASLVLRWMTECAEGLKYLHSQNIVHRDIKPANVLISGGKRGVAKLGDFGLAKEFANPCAGASMTNPAAGAIGTALYLAPELISGDGNYTPMSDVYALGIVMWECVAREVPYADEPVHRVQVQVMNGARPSFEKLGASPESRLPLDYATVAKQCWDGDPRNRPSGAELAARLEVMRFKSRVETGMRELLPIAIRKMAKM